MDPLIFYWSLACLWTLAFGSDRGLLAGTAPGAGKPARARRR